MTIREWNDNHLFRVQSHVVVRSSHGGVFVTSMFYVMHTLGMTPLYVCDTPAEAERIRLLLEQRREEIEAIERRYELLLAHECEVSAP